MWTQEDFEVAVAEMDAKPRRVLGDRGAAGPAVRTFPPPRSALRPSANHRASTKVDEPAPDSFNMDRDRCQELIKLALQKRKFPPRLHLPEVEVDSTITLFSCPYVVWVPESTRASRRPACIDRACACTPTLKEDRRDETCVFDKKQEIPRSRERLCAALATLRSAGKSKPLFQQIHDGIMSADGLEWVRVAVERARYSRYYFLLHTYAIDTSNSLDQESASFSDGLLESNSVLSVVETPATTLSGVGFDTNALACHNIDLETNIDPASETTPQVYPIVGLEASALLPSNERNPVEMISKKDLENMRTISEAMGKNTRGKW